MTKSTTFKQGRLGLVVPRAGCHKSQFSIAAAFYSGLNSNHSKITIFWVTTNPESGQVVTKIYSGRTFFLKSQMLLWPPLWRKYSQGNILRDTLIIERETVNTASSKIKNHKMGQPVPVSPTQRTAYMARELQFSDKTFLFRCGDGDTDKC